MGISYGIILALFYCHTHYYSAILHVSYIIIEVFTEFVIFIFNKIPTFVYSKVVVRYN